MTRILTPEEDFFIYTALTEMAALRLKACDSGSAADAEMFQKLADYIVGASRIEVHYS